MPIWQTQATGFKAVGQAASQGVIAGAQLGMKQAELDLKDKQFEAERQAQGALTDYYVNRAMGGTGMPGAAGGAPAGGPAGVAAAIGGQAGGGGGMDPAQAQWLQSQPPEVRMAYAADLQEQRSQQQLVVAREGIAEQITGMVEAGMLTDQEQIQGLLEGLGQAGTQEDVDALGTQVKGLYKLGLANSRQKRYASEQARDLAPMMQGWVRPTANPQMAVLGQDDPAILDWEKGQEAYEKLLIGAPGEDIDALRFELIQSRNGYSAAWEDKDNQITALRDKVAELAFQADQAGALGNAGGPAGVAEVLGGVPQGPAQGQGQGQPPAEAPQAPVPGQEAAAEAPAPYTPSMTADQIEGDQLDAMATAFRDEDPSAVAQAIMDAGGDLADKKLQRKIQRRAKQMKASRDTLSPGPGRAIARATPILYSTWDTPMQEMNSVGWELANELERLQGISGYQGRKGDSEETVRVRKSLEAMASKFKDREGVWPEWWEGKDRQEPDASTGPKKAQAQ